LMEEVDNEASHCNDLMMKIYRIEDYYDKNIAKLKAERYRSGRRIHERRTMAELNRDQ